MHSFCRKHPPILPEMAPKIACYQAIFKIWKIVSENLKFFWVQRKMFLSQERSDQLLTKMSTLRDTFKKIWSGVPLFTIPPALRASDMSLSARSSGEPHLHPLSCLCSLSLRVSLPSPDFGEKNSHYHFHLILGVLKCRCILAIWPHLDTF